MEQGFCSHSASFEYIDLDMRKLAGALNSDLPSSWHTGQYLSSMSAKTAASGPFRISCSPCRNDLPERFPRHSGRTQPHRRFTWVA